MWFVLKNIRVRERRPAKIIFRFSRRASGSRPAAFESCGRLDLFDARLSISQRPAQADMDYIGSRSAGVGWGYLPSRRNTNAGNHRHHGSWHYWILSLMDSRASSEPFGQQSSDDRCHCDHYCDCFPGTGCVLARCAALRSTRDLHSPTAAPTKSQLRKH
jgi:hypothetical protein